MTDPKIAPCYLCALHPVPSVIVIRPTFGPEKRLPGICDHCKRAHLSENQPN